MVYGIGRTAFYDNILGENGIAFLLGQAIDEIDFSGRLNEFNHHEFFPVGITAILDTFPIYVGHPSCSHLSKLLYQPKYKAHCYKVPR